MTLLPIQNAIIAVLAEKDTFTAADFNGIPLPEKLEGMRDGLIRAVLADLVAVNMLRAVAPDDNSADGRASLWILSSPLGSNGHQVSISMETSSAIAEEINAFIEATGEEWPEADALNIGEHNILMLLAIVARMRSEVDEEESE